MTIATLTKLRANKFSRHHKMIDEKIKTSSEWRVLDDNDGIYLLTYTTQNKTITIRNNNNNEEIIKTVCHQLEIYMLESFYCFLYSATCLYNMGI
jgi:hypothetical protein